MCLKLNRKSPSIPSGPEVVIPRSSINLSKTLSAEKKTLLGSSKNNREGSILIYNFFYNRIGEYGVLIRLVSSSLLEQEIPSEHTIGGMLVDDFAL